MTEGDLKALPPELADPADIQALQEISQRTGISATEMIRDAIHKAVLAHRAWDTPFFDEPHISRPGPSGQGKPLTEMTEAEVADWILYAPDLDEHQPRSPDVPDAIVRSDDRVHLIQTTYHGERVTGSGDALAAARAMRLRNPAGWDAIRTLLLHERLPHRVALPELRRAHAAVGEDSELRALLQKLNQAAETLRHQIDAAENAPLLLVEGQADTEVLDVLVQSAATPEGDPS
ncbi:hypothetical protein [Streptomyces sp. NPDC056191]|uniref:hypothetical protein n=1 Tax=unclassified Streptomyces TaxID=2593676 RepID=UPI0035DE475B